MILKNFISRIKISNEMEVPSMNRKKLSITIDAQIKEIIDHEAEKQNISISRAVERLVCRLPA